jgi:hypothetical protein
MRNPTLKQAVAKLRKLALTFDGTLVNHAVEVQHGLLGYWHHDNDEETWRCWIQGIILSNGISAADKTFELAYLQLKNKIEQYKEKEVKHCGNPE